MGRWVVALVLTVSCAGARADERNCDPEAGLVDASCLNEPPKPGPQPGPDNEQLLPHDWLVVPGERVGPITRDSSEAELRRYFGWRNVHTAEISVGEGDKVWGTIVFPDDPERKLEIVWKDADSRERPQTVMMFGARSRWRTGDGISLGMSLAELERLNDGLLTITGFGWDYSGTVTNAAGGKLGFLGADGGLFIRLNPSDASIEANKDAFQSVLGDGEFRSDDPAMRTLHPTIYEMVVTFR